MLSTSSVLLLVVVVLLVFFGGRASNYRRPSPYDHLPDVGVFFPPGTWPPPYDYWHKFHRPFNIDKYLFVIAIAGIVLIVANGSRDLSNDIAWILGQSRDNSIVESPTDTLSGPLNTAFVKDSASRPIQEKQEIPELQPGFSLYSQTQTTPVLHVVFFFKEPISLKNASRIDGWVGEQVDIFEEEGTHFRFAALLIREGDFPTEESLNGYLNTLRSGEFHRSLSTACSEIRVIDLGPALKDKSIRQMRTDWSASY